MNKITRKKLKQRVKFIYKQRLCVFKEKSESIAMDLAKRYNKSERTIYNWIAQ